MHFNNSNLLILLSYMITTLKIHTNCIGCDSCRPLCPENAIILANHNYIIDTWRCTSCLICLKICPADCIKIMQDDENDIDKKTYV